MKVGDLLSADHVRLPLSASTVEEGFAELLPLVGGERAASVARVEGDDAVAGRIRLRVVGDGTLQGQSAAEDAPAMAVGLAPSPLVGSDVAADRAAGPRVLFLLRRTGLPDDGLERLRRALADPDVETGLLQAGSVPQLLGFRRLMDVELERPLRVSDVMVPLTYRVYPATPVDEVLDLIARRHLEAVPVVDEQLRVLGVVSAGEALQHALRRRGKGPGARPESGEAAARDIMTRAVLCVAEDQGLLDAAQLMASRKAAQLPVVREGEIVGFLTRNGVFSALFHEGGEETGSSSKDPDT